MGRAPDAEAERVDLGGLPPEYYYSPFAVYCPVKHNRNQRSACTYYRVHVPLFGMHNLDLAHCFLDDGRWPVDFSISAAFSADVNMLYALSGKPVKDMIDQCRELEPGPDAAGRLRYPPSVVWDIDDNIDYVHPFNVTFSHFGFRNFDGKELEPGDGIYVRVPKGEPIPLWLDKRTRGHHHEMFDIERNKAFVREAHTMPAYADGATFSTKRLGEWYKENWGLKEYHVFPNSVIPEHYPQVDLLPRTDGSVRIVWQGGMSHAPDWHPIVDATAKVMKKHPNAKLVIWGDPNLGLKGKVPDEQLEFMPWFEYGEYKPRRVMVDADINLCPLVENDFNRCKSAIKFYESVMPKRPEATLAANVPPYSDELVDGETALLYSTPAEYAQKLSTLIERAELRRSLAESARTWVLLNRDYRVTVPSLFAYYQELRERKKAQYNTPQVIVPMTNGGIEGE